MKIILFDRGYVFNIVYSMYKMLLKVVAIDQFMQKII